MLSSRLAYVVIINLPTSLSFVRIEIDRPKSLTTMVIFLGISRNMDIPILYPKTVSSLRDRVGVHRRRWGYKWGDSLPPTGSNHIEPQYFRLSGVLVERGRKITKRSFLCGFYANPINQKIRIYFSPLGNYFFFSVGRTVWYFVGLLSVLKELKTRW